MAVGQLWALPVWAWVFAFNSTRRTRKQRRRRRSSRNGSSSWGVVVEGAGLVGDASVFFV